MKDNLGDIEKLFQESFEGFESDVDPNVWNNISNQIGGQTSPQDPSSVSSSASSAGNSGMIGLGAGKIAAIVGTVSILSLGAFYVLSEEKTPVSVDQDKPEQAFIETQAESDQNQRQVQDKVVTPEEIQESTYNHIDQKENANSESISENKADAKQQSHSSKEVSSELNAVNNVDQPESNQVPAEPEIIAVANTSGPEKSKKENTTEVISPEEEIELKDNFEASIYASVKSGTQPLEVEFQNRGSQAESISWDFGDGQKSNAHSEYHEFVKSGEYWVVLQIRNDDGRVSKDSTKITVSGKAYVSAPNVFTPNNDGTNDAFMVESDYVSNFTCRIFDRNSKLIYEWSNKYGHWDGRDMSNNIAPVGTYFYIIEAVDMDGQPLEPNRGTVLLSR